MKVGSDMLHLQTELEQAKSSLKDVDDNIKKLIGRDPSELPPRQPKRPIGEDKSRPPRLLGRGGGGGFTHENEEPPLVKQRKNVSVFKRLSEKVTDDFPQKGLISKVIVTNKEVPSREEALRAQNKDVKSKERNRRMFGALMGTLQKFQQEETKLKPKEDKRAQLEKKIEEHEIKEKEEIKRERQELFQNRRKKQAEIKMIELKMLRMKEYAAWEENQKPRRNFIMTKAYPPVYYLPRRSSTKSRQLLAESRAAVDELIEREKQITTEELKHIEERIKRGYEDKSEVKEEKERATEENNARLERDNSPDADDVVNDRKIKTEKISFEEENIEKNGKDGEAVSSSDHQTDSNEFNVDPLSTSTDIILEQADSEMKD